MIAKMLFNCMARKGKVWSFYKDVFLIHPIIRLDVDVSPVDFGQGLKAGDDLVGDGMRLSDGGLAINVDV